MSGTLSLSASHMTVYRVTWRAQSVEALCVGRSPTGRRTFGACTRRSPSLRCVQASPLKSTTQSSFFCFLYMRDYLVTYLSNGGFLRRYTACYSMMDRAALTPPDLVSFGVSPVHLNVSLTAHETEPGMQGEKWIATKWLQVEDAASRAAAALAGREPRSVQAS
jgi:hypothetical protein